MLHPLDLWMRQSTTQEKKELATRCGFGYRYLYQLQSGGRRASADMAARIEVASLAMRPSNPSLPIIWRFELCDACAGCPFSPSSIGEAL